MELLPDGAHLLRGGDLGCARLLILLRKEATALVDGTVVHLETTDPIAPIDLPAWCRITGHEYLGPVADEGIPRYGVRVRVGAKATDPAFPWRVVERTSGRDQDQRPGGHLDTPGGTDGGPSV